MASVDKKIVDTGIGPGGWGCTCCAPPKGKSRKRLMRAKRKAIKREWKTDVKTALSDFDITS